MHSKLLLVLIVFLSIFTKAQTGKISGTILDSKTGETLPGATVLIDGTTKGASADFDGKFSINNVTIGKVTLVVNYISYNSKKITNVNVQANDVTNINVLLDPSTSQDLTEVEVVVTLNKENNTALVLQQKNNASVSDGISAETIKRTPDRNTADVLKRISGVTIQDDKFVIIRGLNERYNASYLNGSPLPSTEPDKKAFAFDLFPSNMLDNIVINKTATPDMPGEFAGGIVQINTKSIPEKNFISFNAGAGYNTVTTNKAKIIYDGGKYDRFGFDDGSRNLPSQIPSLDEKASWIANKDQARVATYFKNDWAYRQSKFSPNTTAQFATGYNFKLKERDFFGVIFSLGYNSTQLLYGLNRNEYEQQSNYSNQSKSGSTIYQTQTSTGALLNLACKIDGNNTISFKNMLTGAADNKFIHADNINYLDAPDVRNRINTRYFTANRIFSSQLNGDHLITKPKIKIGWNAGISTIQRSVPNFRSTSYSKNIAILDPSDPHPKDTVYMADIASGQGAGPNYAGYRVYSKLNEKIQNLKFDISRPFKLNENFKIDAKIGALYQDRIREYSIRQFGLNQYSAGGTPGNPGYIAKDDSLLYLPEDLIFSAQNMSVTPLGTGGFKASEITHADDNYKALSKLLAYFSMAEFKFKDKIRLIGGIRYESYTQQVNVKYGKIDSTIVKSTINDYLPSVNLIYNINEKLGIRLAYYKTLNRAEFRELAVTNWYDPETKLSTAGNAALTRCYIQNYDARFEVYPGRGQLFTVSGFYKYFNTPIERYMLSGNESQIYYRNANFGHVIGGELEYRVNVGAVLKTDSIKFLNNLSLFSNLALIKSEVDVKGLNSAVPNTRTMQGQAPYIINTGISYIDNDNGFSVTGMLNRVGERIWLVGNEIDGNRWEKARTVVDLQLTKSFFKNKLELRLNVKDLLHNDYIIYYKGDEKRKSNVYDPKKDYVNFIRNYGSVYSFIISYRF